VAFSPILEENMTGELVALFVHNQGSFYILVFMSYTCKFPENNMGKFAEVKCMNISKAVSK
jgi:hypothetical protein